MKKIYTLSILIVVAISGCSSSEYEYWAGKDTVEICGDGRFQILAGPSGDLNLNNEATDEVMDPFVFEYQKNDPFLYVSGKEGYTSINCDTNEINNYPSLDEIPGEEKQVFTEL